MKLIGFDNNYFPLADGAAEIDGASPALLTFPDSCLIHAGKPAFVPPLGEPNTVWLSAAVRICRLGKCIDRTFASRYFDAVCIGANIRAEGLLQKLRAASLPWDAATCFDGSIAVGRFTAPDAPDSPMRGFTATCGSESFCWAPDAMHRSAAEIVALASEFRTLKTGDIIFLGFARAFTSSIGSTITVHAGTPAQPEADLCAEPLLRLPIR